jgi:hypothetical protein
MLSLSPTPVGPILSSLSPSLVAQVAQLSLARALPLAARPRSSAAPALLPHDRPLPGRRAPPVSSLSLSPMIGYRRDPHRPPLHHMPSPLLVHQPNWHLAPAPSHPVTPSARAVSSPALCALLAVAVSLAGASWTFGRFLPGRL